MQRVPIARAGGDQPFEQAGGARRLVALQIHAREADPSCTIGRVDLGRAAERALRAFDLVLIEQPQPQSPVRGRVGGIELDRAAHVAHRIVDFAEARFHGGEVKPPLRLRALDRGRCRVAVAGGADQPVGLAHHAEAAPANPVARVLRDALARLADDVLDFRGERAERRERRRSRRPGARRPE